MNTKIKVGRPKKFDRDEAIQIALELFWAKGYDGTSVKDLTDAIGINAPSLYAEFGDKLNLYKLTIDAYANNDGCAPLTAFETTDDIAGAVRAFMTAAIDYSTEHRSGVKGCFLASCVVTHSGAVNGVQQRLQKSIEDTDQRMAKRFNREKSKGTLSKDFPSLERARLLFDLRQGHVFRARAGLPAETMKADLEHRVKMVLAFDDQEY